MSIILSRNVSIFIILFLIMLSQVFASIRIDRSYIINFNDIPNYSQKNETAQEFFDRFYSHLQSNFDKDKKNFTYNFLERYFQHYSNIPKNIIDKEIMTDVTYNQKKDVVDVNARFHFYKQEDEIMESNVKASIKIRKDNGKTISFAIKNEFQWHIRQLINLYLNLGYDDKIILDESTTTVSIDSTRDNSLKIDIVYIIYGKKIQEKLVDDEMNFLEEVTKKVILEFIE